MSHRSNSSNSGRSYQAQPEFRDNNPAEEPPTHDGLPLHNPSQYVPHAPPGSSISSSSYEPGALHSGPTTPSSFPNSSQYGQQHGHQSSGSYGSSYGSRNHPSSSDTSGLGSVPEHFPPPPAGPGPSQGYGQSANYSSSSGNESNPYGYVSEESDYSGMYGADGQQHPPGHRYTTSDGSSMYGHDGQQNRYTMSDESSMYGHDGQYNRPGHGYASSGASSTTMYGQDGQTNDGAGHYESDYTSQYGQDGQDASGHQEAGGPHHHGTFFEDENGNENGPADHPEYGGPGTGGHSNYGSYYEE